MLARVGAVVVLRAGRGAVSWSAAVVDLAEAQLLRAGVSSALMGAASTFEAF